MGFGGGAIIGRRSKDALIETFYRQPAYLGTSSSVRTELDGSGGRKVALWWTAAAAAGRGHLPNRKGKSSPRVPRLPAYIPGGLPGQRGVAETWVVLGIVYLVYMMGGAFGYRVPAPGWKPAGWTAPRRDADSMITHLNVTPSEALRTPQFWLLWVVLCFNVTAGIGVLGVAKTMLSEIFGPTLPQIVTPGFATTFVLMISVFNMLGRFFWSSLSAYLGRKRTYAIYFLLGIPLYLSIPFFAYRESISPAVFWLVSFYAVSMLIFSMYGGGFATIPAYLADLFGTKYVGGIHGRLLTAWSTAGVIGPWVITTLRERSLRQAVSQVAGTIDPAKFESQFARRSANWKTRGRQDGHFARLMEIAPAGTIDPPQSCITPRCTRWPYCCSLLWSPTRRSAGGPATS
jgi:hypothetical protein